MRSFNFALAGQTKITKKNFRFCRREKPERQLKNLVKLIGLKEVFLLEKFPSKFEATPKLQRWRIFQSWQKFGKNRENAWRFSFSDRFFRKILVKIFFHTKCGKISSEKLLLGALVVQSKERSDTLRTFIKGHTHVKSSKNLKFIVVSKIYLYCGIRIYNLYPNLLA